MLAGAEVGGFGNRDYVAASGIAYLRKYPQTREERTGPPRRNLVDSGGVSTYPTRPSIAHEAPHRPPGRLPISSAKPLRRRVRCLRDLHGLRS